MRLRAFSFLTLRIVLPAAALSLALACSAAAATLERDLLYTTGANSGDRYGSAMARLRDFDGDGAPDLAIGAYGYRAGASAGRVYLLHAGATPASVPWMSFGGSTSNELFGFSLAAARDVNGDGWSDLIVGSPRSSGEAPLSGRAFVYFGGPSADTVADLRFSGTEANQQFGLTVACPGDVNGDGWDDVMVGAYNPLTLRGTVSLFFGGPAADTIPHLVLHSPQLRDNLGYAIAGAGDLNHDGFADFVVGTPLYSTGTPPRQEGRVYVYFGGADPDTLPDLVLTGKYSNQHFGQCVGGGADVNGDGVDDWIAGDGARDTRLFLGGAVPDTLADLTYNGGLSSAVVGDVNADGYADLALALSDRVWVYFGSAQPDANLDLTLLTSANPVVGAVGDLDGDDVADLAVGLPFERVGGPALGAVRAWQLVRYIVVEPNGGERWVAGSRDTLRWLGSDSLSVDLSLDGGLTWNPLAAGSGGGLGRLAVNVPDTLTQNAKIRISPPAGYERAATSDAGDAPFTIAAYEVANPGGGSSWSVADPETVSWRGARAADVYLSGRGGASPVRLAARVGGGEANQVAFTVPLVNSDSVVARVVVAGTDGAGPLGAESARAVRVVAFQLLHPNGGEILSAGGEDSVVWLGSMRANVQISLDDGATWTLLAANAGGEPRNTVNVRVPRGFSSRARMRVVATGQTATAGHFDQSDATFFVAESQPLPNLPLRTAFHSAYGDTEDTFGQAVAPAGDLNADGYTDLIVGAPLANVGSLADAGSAEIFFGGPGADDQPDLVLYGSRRGAQFGYAVAGVGDFDGDGFDDFVVGAPGYSGTTSGSGIVYFYRGGPGLDDVPDQTFAARTNQAAFGQSLAGVGDVNGDGLGDFVAGGLSNAVTVSVPLFFGNAALGTVPAVQLTSPVVSDRDFGTLVASAGDFNGDGWGDIVVRRQPGLGTTSVYFYWGGPGMDGFSDLELQGPRTYSFANSVSSIGDFNADGFSDIAIGTPTAANGSGAPGKVQIFYGATHPAVHSLDLWGTASGERFGIAVAGGADINGDGFADLVVGADRSGGGGVNSGRAYVYYGYVTPDTAARLRVDGSRPQSFFGQSAATLARFGTSDLAAFAIGSPQGDARTPNGGEAFVYELDHPMLLTPLGDETWVAGEPAEIRWTSALPVTLELTTDGGANWMALASNAGGAAENRFTLTVPDEPTSEARVRLRRESLPIAHATSDESRTNFRITRRPPPAPAALRARRPSDPEPPPVPGARAGSQLAIAGDVNGDGKPDLLVARRAESGGSFQWVVDLESGAGGGVLTRYHPPRATDAVAIAGAGDINGDGFADVVIGVPGDDSRAENAGRVYLYWGAAAPDADADVVFEGSRAGDRFGAAVAAVGDLGGDGFADLVVGAPRAASLPKSPGAALLFLGGTHPDPSPDAVLEGATPGDGFGTSVAGLGDMNGDGCREIAIGAPGPDAFGKNTGRVYVYCGGASSATAPELTLVGEAEGDRFGQTVAAAGDVNGDGFMDLLVGAPWNDGLAPDAGRAYLYLGGLRGDIAPDAVMSGASRGGAFATSLAGGVDENGDGYSDWMIGSPFAGADERGGAWLFEGGVAPDGVPERAWTGDAAGDRLGAALAMSPRPGPASYGDLVLGAPFADLAAEGGAPAGDAGAVRTWEAGRWWLEEPRSGDVWPVGSERDIHWQGTARAEVALVRAGGTEEVLAGDAGGAEENVLRIKVGGPGGAARVRLRSSVSGVPGEAWSDSVALESAVALRTLALSSVPGAGVRLEWATAPNLADGGVIAYRLYRRAPGLALSQRIGPDSIRATSYVYAERVRGATYVLSALTAAGAEVVLGEATLAAGPAGLQVWPMPLAAGASATIEFVAPVDALGRTPADLEVDIFDLAGRRVATLARGARDTDVGVLRLEWNGRGAEGRPAASGIYFARALARSAAFELQRRVVVTR